MPPKFRRSDATYRGDTNSKNLHKKLAPNRTQLYSVLVSCTRNFQTQPTNQTAQFWSRASVQVLVLCE